MSDAAPSILSSWREILLGLFPFLARFHIRPVSEGGALEIKSAGQKIEIQGGGRPASGSGHFVCRLCVYTGGLVPVLYYSESLSEPYTWAPVSTSALMPSIHTAGTAIHINEGSGKVEIDA